MLSKEYNGDSYLFGLKWSKLEGESKLSRDREISNAIKARSEYAGISFKTERSYQFTTTDLANVGQVAAAIAVQKYLERRAIFYMKMELTDDVEDKYWLAIISELGEIVDNSDVIVNAGELADIIEDTQNFFDDDIEVFAPMNDMSLFPDDDIQQLSFEEIVNNFDTSDAVIIQLKTEIKPAYLIAGVLLSVIVGYFAYNEITNESPLMNDIKMGVYTQAQHSRYISIDEEYNKFKKSSAKTQDEIDALAGRQLSDIFKAVAYDEKEIIANFKKINNKLNRYYAEWELVEIRYKNNKFTVVYSKIVGSNGSIDGFIKSFESDLKRKKMEYKMVETDEKLASIKYEIMFGAGHDTAPKKIEIYDPEDYRAKYEDLKKSAVDVLGNIDEQTYGVMNLGFYDSRWGSTLKNIKSNLEKSAMQLSTINDSLEDLLREEKNKKQESVAANKGATKMYGKYVRKYINQAQQMVDSRITYPTKFGNLPDLNEGKKNTINEEKLSPGLEYPIEIYKFSIMSNLEESNNLNAMEYYTLQFKDKNLLYNEIDYDIKSGNWTLRGTIYETK